MIQRRHFLEAIASGTLLVLGCSGRKPRGLDVASRAGPFFVTRGVVLVPDDLTSRDWPERARAAGLTTLAIHHGVSPSVVSAFVRSDAGAEVLERCRRLGLDVEYELHAMRELLPRKLFEVDPSLFRQDEKGERTPDANLCASSPRALEIAAENAVEISRTLRPTTGRYFLWGDDGQPGCRCCRCSGLSDSEQALILENRILRALREADPKASVAHLAYAGTLAPPRRVRPEPGIFLEFAPIAMKHDRPGTSFAGPANRDYLDALDSNLAVFPPDTAQALEYWLDVSLQSGWTRPASRLSFREDLLREDLDAYGSRGIRHVTTFAVFVDSVYVARYGEPLEVRAYGELLAGWRPPAGRG